jgi:hypothetical protein
VPLAVCAFVTGGLALALLHVWRGPDAPYSGPPYLAFLAHRRMPGGQPDGFLPRHSPAFKEELAEVTADQPLCP